MISNFVKEQKRYTQAELRDNIFCCSEQEVVLYIRKLKEYGILKIVSASDIQRTKSELLDNELEISDVSCNDHDSFYIFTFVGIITMAGRVLKCYPKYIQTNPAPTTELQQILKILEKYNHKQNIVHIFDDSNEYKSFNLLAILLFFLNDYYANGLYINTETIIKSSGQGEILWEKTINETFAYVNHKRPYYFDIKTRQRINNEYDYFSRLHKYILSKASNELSDAGLLDLFEMSAINFPDDEQFDLGDSDFILYMIEKELNIQFNSRKQALLKAIYVYIANGGNISDDEAFSFFGTNNFAHVWEDVCSTVLDSQLNVLLENLPLPQGLSEKYSPNKTLLEIIEKPYWSICEKEAKDSFIPDLISIHNNGASAFFIICDAKYYTPSFLKGAPPREQPGIESVAKQFLYQLAYYDFIQDHKFSKFANYFLFPTEHNSIINGGNVSLDMFQKLGLSEIKIRFLPVREMFSLYLNGKKINPELLIL